MHRWRVRGNVEVKGVSMRRLIPFLAAWFAVVVVGVSGASGPVGKTPAACLVDLWPQPRLSACASGAPLGSDASKAPSPASVGRLRLAWVVKVGKSIASRSSPPAEDLASRP